MVSTSQKFNLYLPESGFALNRWFLQDTVMFDVDKRR